MEKHGSTKCGREGKWLCTRTDATHQFPYQYNQNRGSADGHASAERDDMHYNCPHSPDLILLQVQDTTLFMTRIPHA
jgi:hypothetical protein